MSSPLTPEQLSRFDAELPKILARFPAEHKAAAMLPLLRLCQELQGFISEEAMLLVADKLGQPVARAREVATFYYQFHVEPHGRHLIEVCTNIGCSLCGAENVLKYLEKKLGVQSGQTTSDKKVTLRETECLASCGTGPMLAVNDVYVENLTPAKLDELLAKLS